MEKAKIFICEQKTQTDGSKHSCEFSQNVKLKTENCATLK